MRGASMKNFPALSADAMEAVRWYGAALHSDEIKRPVLFR